MFCIPCQLFMLRAAAFLLPCYIMAWAISILQRRRQRQVKLYLSRNRTLTHKSKRMYLYVLMFCVCEIPGSSRSSCCRSCVYATQRGWRWRTAQRRIAFRCSTRADTESTTPAWSLTTMIIYIPEYRLKNPKYHHYPRLWSLLSSLSLSFTVCSSCLLFMGLFLWAKTQKLSKTKYGKSLCLMFLQTRK